MNHYNQNNANENQILLIIKKERKTFRVDFVCLSHLQRHHLIKKEAFKMSFITMKTTHKILIWPVSAVLGKKKRFQKASSRLSSSAGQRGWSPRPASGPVTRVCSPRATPLRRGTEGGLVASTCHTPAARARAQQPRTLARPGGGVGRLARCLSLFAPRDAAKAFGGRRFSLFTFRWCFRTT